MNRLKTLIISAASLLTMFFLVTPAIASAVDCTNPANADTTACAIQGGVNAAAGGADTSNAGKSLSTTVTNVINILSLVIGIAAVIVIMIGGFKYITSSGNDSQVASAKSTILYAVIGIVIVAFAQIIVKFVINKTTCATTGDNTSCSSAPPNAYSEGQNNSLH